MKKWLIVLAVLTMAFVTGCAKQGLALDDQKQVMTDYLTTLKSGDFESAKPYLTEVNENFDYNDNPVMKAFFAKLTFEVKSIEAKGSGSVAKVTIKLPNTSIIYDEMMSSIGEDVQKLQAGNDQSKNKASEMMVAYMLEKINSDQVVMVENTVDVDIDTASGKPLIVPSDNFSKALSGLTVQ